MTAVQADRQGDAPDVLRVERAMSSFVKDFGRTAAIHMESCIHCGQCAQACHYYEVSKDPRHTPVWKLEPFKQAYKREAGPFSPLYRALNFKKRVTVAQLEEWQELLYDTCTMCGRCTMACPMGIDIASLVGQARHAMFAAGLVPAELHAVAERAEREGSPLGATPKVFRERIEWLADEAEIDIPVDKDRASVLCTMSSVEIMKYPQSLVATAKVMNHLGLDWTFRSDGYEATNFGLLSGNTAWQRDMSMKLIDAAIACGAAGVVVDVQAGLLRESSLDARARQALRVLGIGGGEYHGRVAGLDALAQQAGRAEFQHGLDAVLLLESGGDVRHRAAQTAGGVQQRLIGRRSRPRAGKRHQKKTCNKFPHISAPLNERSGHASGRTGFHTAAPKARSRPTSPR